MDAINGTGTSPRLPPSPTVALDDDVGAELAVLGVESGKLERTEATDGRNAEEELAQTEAQQEVQSLRSEAGTIASQAWMDGAIGVLQAASGGKSSTLGAVLVGAKGAGDGLYGAEEKGDEATAKGCEAAVGAAQAGAEGAHDAITGADQLVQSTLEFYKEYVSTTAQTENAIAQRA
jgi:hypothetical protein